MLNFSNIKRMGYICEELNQMLMTPKIITEFGEIIQQDIHTQILSHNPKPRKTTWGETGPFQPHNLAPQIYTRNVKMKLCINY